MRIAASRHIDLDAVMLWRSLGDIGPCSVAHLVEHWRPTFTAAEVRDALRRLEAHGKARSDGESRWVVTGEPLPGIADQPNA